ncbi:MAG: hypothetical protein IPM59_00240 [Chloracidobacterium sp.]|nr:hypothetical protein [Chloracidobacterium sp.]
MDQTLKYLPARRWCLAVGPPGIVDLTHQPTGLGEGDDDLLVVPDVLE